MQFTIIDWFIKLYYLICSPIRSFTITLNEQETVFWSESVKIYSMTVVEPAKNVVPGDGGWLMRNVGLLLSSAIGTSQLATASPVTGFGSSMTSEGQWDIVGAMVSTPAKIK